MRCLITREPAPAKSPSWSLITGRATVTATKRRVILSCEVRPETWSRPQQVEDSQSRSPVTELDHVKDMAAILSARYWLPTLTGPRSQTPNARRWVINLGRRVSNDTLLCGNTGQVHGFEVGWAYQQLPGCLFSSTSLFRHDSRASNPTGLARSHATHLISSHCCLCLILSERASRRGIDGRIKGASTRSIKKRQNVSNPHQLKTTSDDVLSHMPTGHRVVIVGQQSQEATPIFSWDPGSSTWPQLCRIASYSHD